MADHSPLPWEGCKANCTCGQVWSIPGDFPVCTGTKTGCVVHEHMADAPDLIYQSISPETKAANAAYIVKACNAYPELVNAVKILLGENDQAQIWVGGNPNAVDKMLSGYRALLTSLGELT